MHTAHTLAQEVGARMEAGDLAGKHLGLRLDEIGPGYARVAMSVRADMVNGHGIAHGGITYTLADTAFAYACNSRNEKSMAHQCSVTYTAPVRIGDELSAEALEIHLQGRTGVYDVRITNQTGETVLLFRGQSFRTREPVV
jgi:acyl-CoA thioesterase